MSDGGTSTSGSFQAGGKISPAFVAASSAIDMVDGRLYSIDALPSTPNRTVTRNGEARKESGSSEGGAEAGLSQPGASQSGSPYTDGEPSSVAASSGTSTQPRMSSSAQRQQQHPVTEPSSPAAGGSSSTTTRKRPTSATKSYASSIYSSSSTPLSSTRPSSRFPATLPYTNSRPTSHAAAPSAHLNGRDFATPSRIQTSIPLSAGPASGGGTRSSPSRFLLTVVPPLHLPHDPPHPRTPAACSGYGPPDKFRRGVLIPLYPTLSSQLGAIAREYGLPSTGGLVVYLVSTSDPTSSNASELPGTSALAGQDGPRIGPEAWDLLWGRLFEVEEEELFEQDESVSDEEDYNSGAPPVPPLPQAHRSNFAQLHNLHDNGLRSADAAFPNSYSDLRSVEEQQFRTSSDSMSDEAEGSIYSVVGPTESAAEPTLVTSQVRQAANLINERHQATANSNSTPPRANSSSSFATRGTSAPNGVPSRVPLPPPTPVTAPRSSRPPASISATSHPSLRQSSRASILSTRSVPVTPLGRQRRGTSLYSNISRPEGVVPPPYGAALIVGKIEFDIDWRRGGRSKWYEGWVEQALGTPGYSASGASRVASYTDSGPPTADASSDRFPRSREVSEGSGPPTARQQELHLPGLVSQRRRLEAQEESNTGEVIPSFPKTPEKWSSSLMGVMGSGGKSKLDPEAAPYVFGSSPGTEEDDSTRRYEPPINSLPRSSSLQDNGLALSSSSSTSPRAAGYAPIATEEGNGYQQLDDGDEFNSPGEGDDEDDDDEEEEHQQQQRSEDNTEEEEEYNSLPLPSPTLLIPFVPPSADDPLGDVFPSDEATWSQMKTEPKADETRNVAHEEKLVVATGLGIFGARVEELSSMAPPGVVESAKKETADEAGIPPPQDDVADIVAMLQPWTGKENANLASPIHLASSPTSPSEGFSAPRAIPEPAEETVVEKVVEISPPQDESLLDQEPSSPPLADSFRSPRTQRKGSHDWANSPGVNRVLPLASMSPVLERSSPRLQLPEHSSSNHSDANRASTIGLMENLDDLERALAELSPRTKKVATGTPRMKPPSADLFSVLATPRGATSTYLKPQIEGETATGSTQPPYMRAPPLTSEIAGYNIDSQLEQNAPRSPLITTSTLAQPVGVASSPEHVTPKGSPAPPEASNARTPRSTSLSKRKGIPSSVAANDAPAQAPVQNDRTLALALETDQSFSPESTRSVSPGRKSRSSKSSSRRGSEPSDKESPKASFFQKPAFKFFRSKGEGSPDSHSSSLPISSPLPIESVPAEAPIFAPTIAPASNPFSSPSVAGDAFPNGPAPPSGAPSYPPHSNPIPSSSSPYSRFDESHSSTPDASTQRATLNSLPSEDDFSTPPHRLSNPNQGRSSLPRDGTSLNPPAFNYREMMAASIASPNGHPSFSSKSAPATPSSPWTAQTATNQQRPRRLAAEMDDLLSQMNEIDFGDEESVGGTEDSNSTSNQPRPVLGTRTTFGLAQAVSSNDVSAKPA